MRIATLPVVLTVGVIVGAGLAVRVATQGDPHGSLAQLSVQAIPGTIGMTLGPPARTRTEVSPQQALQAMGAVPSGTSVTLAGIADPLEGLDIGAAWVAIARGLCLRDSKGELVSDARGDDPNDLECTDATFQVIAIDATDGHLLLSTTGYDETLTWAPDVAGA